MTQTLRNVSDRPRYDQFSTTHRLSTIPFGFSVSVAGAILTGTNSNPPQVFVTAGANNKEYLLQVPKGNPAKCWVYITSDDDIIASVTDYSTVATNGVLTIDLDTAPTGNTNFRGFICYGRVADENPGAVSTVPDEVTPVISHGQYVVDSVLEEAMMLPVSWEVTAGAPKMLVAPLGTTVADAGAGIYDITFPFKEPHHFEENWALTFGESAGRQAAIAVQTSTDASFVVRVTFHAGVDMGVGDTAHFLAMGSPKGYEANYGATNAGGVHSDLISRDIHNSLHYPQMSSMRAITLYPFSVTMGATTTGPDASLSRIPSSTRIERTGVGVYVIYIGSFPTDGICAAFSADDGTAVGVTAYDEAAGTLTVTAASELAGDTLSGFVIAKTQGVD